MFGGNGCCQGLRLIWHRMDISVKQFTFSDRTTDQSITVKIQEAVEADYGLYIWPCAPVLAQYIWLNRSKVAGKNIIEIGAGTSLPGLVAAKCGASVILSDRSSFTNCLQLCRQNAELNGLADIPVLGVTWGQVAPAFISLPKLHIILTSDCFYDSKDFEDVIMTLSYLLQKNPDAEVWCSYQERSSDRTIEYLLDRWQLYGEQVDIPNMETVESSFDGYSCHVIHLFIIRLRRE